MAAIGKTRRIPAACAFAFAAALTLTPSALYAHGGGGGGGGGGMGGGGMGMGAGGPHGGFGLGGAAAADPGPFSHVSPGPSMMGGQSASHISTNGMSHSNGPNALDRDRGLNRAEDRRSASGTLHSRSLRRHHRHQVVPDADEMMNDGIH